MKRLAWTSAGILALAGWASPGAAQAPFVRVSAETAPVSVVSPFRSRPCPPGQPCPSAPSTPSLQPPQTPEPGATPPAATEPTPTPTPDFSQAGEFKGSTGRTSSVVAGTGLGGAVTGDPTLTSIFTPLVIPGLFSVGAGQSALPVDRVSIDYGYFNGVAVRGVGTSAPMLSRATITTPGPILTVKNPNSPPPVFINVPTFTTTVHTLGVTQSADPVPGFNLHTFNISVEKTFLDGLASAYVTVPFLNATENISGQPINGLGDVSAGFKMILYQSLPTGNTLTGGFTISFPTAHAGVSTSYVQSGNGFGDTLLPSSSVTINPTFLQPWVAGLFVFDRLYVHEYFAIVVPTDDRISAFLNNDLSVGYALFRAGEAQWFTSVTPTLGISAFIPLSNRGTPSGLGAATFVPEDRGGLPPAPPPSLFSFNDQISVSAGVQLGIAERWLFSANVVVPVAGPHGYSVGATFGLNYFY